MGVSNNENDRNIIERLVSDRDIEGLLERFKTDKSEEIIQALGNTGDGRAVEPLVDLMLQQRNIAHTIAYALGHIEEEKGISRLIELLSERDEDTRAIATYALGCICNHRWSGSNDRVAMALTNAFLDKSARVRARAIHALADVLDEKAIDLIILAYYDPDEHVRKCAVQASAFMTDREQKLYKAIWDAAADPRVGRSIREEMYRIDNLPLC